jgi:4'-phosphopantetheinyl transferase
VRVTDDDADGRVHVTWLPGADVDDSALVRLIGEAVGTIGSVRIVRACRSCGSDRHGKPHVVVAGGSPLVFVSLARSGGRAVVAVTEVGEVGVDVEALASGDPDDLVEWVRAESLVKATGHGLATDPATLDVPRTTVDLDAPDGFVAAVTVLSRRRLTVTTR